MEEQPQPAGLVVAPRLTAQPLPAAGEQRGDLRGGDDVRHDEEPGRVKRVPLRRVHSAAGGWTRPPELRSRSARVSRAALINVTRILIAEYAMF